MPTTITLHSIPFRAVVAGIKWIADSALVSPGQSRIQVIFCIRESPRRYWREITHARHSMETQAAQPHRVRAGWTDSRFWSGALFGADRCSLGAAKWKPRIGHRLLAQQLGKFASLIPELCFRSLMAAKDNLEWHDLPDEETCEVRKGVSTSASRSRLCRVTAQNGVSAC
jgi:hypothetical protein